MAWEEIKQGLRALTGPVVWLASGFDTKITVDYINGSDNNSSSNSITTDDQKLKEMEDKIAKQGQEKDEKIAELFDTIKELRKNPRENQRDIEKRFREIQRGIEERNRRMTEQIAQKEDKLEEAKNQIAMELKEAVAKGESPTKIAALNEKMKDIAKANAENNLEKKNMVTKNDLKQLQEEINKPLLRRVRWSNPFNWIALLAFVLFSYSIFWAINWVRSKFRKLFSSSNE